MNLNKTLYEFLKQYGFDRTYWVAYSGGLDSHVLLHACVELRKLHPLDLRAIHIHHGISSHADAWLKHCAAVCASNQVDFIAQHVDVSASEGESLENIARQKRYAALAQVINENDILLTAQHQDDQAETVLLQLFRGAGSKGLSAMPRVKSFALGLHARPLLDLTRAELEVYARVNQLCWIEDEMNADLHYARNFIRHQVMPLLKQHWPAVGVAAARAAEHCAETENLLAHFAAQELVDLAGSNLQTLSVRALLRLSPERQRLALRTWLAREGMPMPSSVKLQHILSDVLLASWDSAPCVEWGGVEVRRYQDDLYVMAALATHDASQVIVWNCTAPLVVPGVGILHASLVLGQGLRSELTDVVVKFRQGGEVYCLSNGQHHELKKFFQEKGIPTWERDRLPLVFVRDELAVIPGYFVVDKFKAQQGEMGWEIVIPPLPSPLLHQKHGGEGDY